MWIMVFFDLPTDTKTERKEAADFRKRIMKDGFTKFQFSVYLRHCSSRENAEVHMRRVRGFVPEHGHVCMICITDKQFSNMENFYAHKPVEPNAPGQQLELF